MPQPPKDKELKVEIHEITKEMLESCAIPKSKYGFSIAWKDTGDEYYEDETYICWNGCCARK